MNFFVLIFLISSIASALVFGQIEFPYNDIIINEGDDLSLTCYCADPTIRSDMDSEDRTNDVLSSDDYTVGIEPRIEINGREVLERPTTEDKSNFYATPFPDLRNGRTGMTLEIETASLSNSSTITCVCQYSADLIKQASTRLFVHSTAFNVSVTIDTGNGNQIIPQLVLRSDEQTGEILGYYLVDLARIPSSQEITAHFKCTYSEGTCDSTPTLMATSSPSGSTKEFRADSFSAENRTAEYTASISALKSQFGSYAFGCFDENSQKHTSVLIAIGRSAQPGEVDKANIKVAESRKTTLSFQMDPSKFGTPTSTLKWYKWNSEVKVNDRISFSNNMTSLEISSADKSDGGTYYCEIKNFFNHTYVRFDVEVIDKYKAVWPFFGLVLEVVFFASAILIYEKHSKKQTDSRK